jgi:MSHA biogenesis protein MshG
MPLFHYQAVDSSGRITSGTHSAEMLQDVEQWLLQNGMSPISIDISAATGTGTDDFMSEATLTLKERLTKVGLEDLILFCRQVSTMLAAGVSVLPALEAISEQVTNPQLRKTLMTIAYEIERGSDLSDAFSAFPKIFNQLFINVIKIGEESGNLDNSFDYLAGLYENEKDVRERIKTATRYPKIVVTSICAAIAFLMTFVVPKFVELFAQAKVQLPLPTRILIAVSNFFANYFLVLLALLILLIAAYRLALKNPEFLHFRDMLLLKIPIFGQLSIKIYMSRFCRVFEVLTQSGINIIKTLELSSSALENVILFDMARQVQKEVEEGVNLNEAMGKHPLFPPMVVQMMAIGEKSGKVDVMMAKVADYYEVETDYTIKNIATLIEPFLLFFMGIIVAVIALSIFLPMWSMMEVMR